jgi:penicillin-binding protein 1A
LWAKIMNAIHADLPVKEFPTKPDNIVEVEVCSQSGKRPVAGVCDQDPRGSCVQTEYFAVGTEPAEDDYCDVHVKYSICNETGELSTGTCPSVTDHIYIQKPEENIIIPENAASAAVPADQQYTVPENMTTTFCHVHNTASTEPTTSNSLFGENPDSEVEADTGYVSEAEAETENHDTPEDNLWESTSEDTTSAEGHSKSNRGFRFYSRD